MKELNKHIESIIARKISGAVTAAEQSELNEWMASSEQNKIYFQNLENIYAKSKPVGTETFPKIDIDYE